MASHRGYDDPGRRFPSHQFWNGIEIHRVRQSGFGKAARWRRALDFTTFSIACLFRLLTLPRQDLVIALTSPPLISALAALLVQLRGGRFVFWVMDLNPDEAIAAGWLRAGSLAGRVLSAALHYSLRRAHQVIALDRFMQQRLAAKGVPASKIAVIPPWPHEVAYDAAGRDEFRRSHGLEGKYVVMYSGNHSPCHPLDTLLEAARSLRTRPHVHFTFVGGGAEFHKVRRFARAHGLENILCLPYQPRERLSASLSAADLHVVAMGDPFVGIVHPCKVYNIRTVGTPFLYIGPSPSHVTELHPAASFRHGETAAVADFIVRSAAGRNGHPVPVPQPPLLASMVEAIESCTPLSFSASRRSSSHSS